MIRVLSALPVLALAIACYGPPVPDSAIEVWEVEEAGELTMVGVSANLAELTAEGAGPSDIIKEMPTRTKSDTWVQLLQFNFNPAGHGPPGVNDVPHIDVHMYNITDEERLAIDCEDQPFPPEEQIPEGVVVETTAGEPFGGCVPEMGVHAYDPSTGHYDEDGRLDYDMIYGFHDAKLIFLEPMIHEQNYIDGVPLELDIPPPAAFETPTKWPMKFVGQLSDDGETYEFAFTDFEDME